MSDWKEKIEAQIARLNGRADYVAESIAHLQDVPLYAEAANVMQALLDVAVAADADSENMGRWLENLFMALDKLREASNE